MNHASRSGGAGAAGPCEERDVVHHVDAAQLAAELDAVEDDRFGRPSRCCEVQVAVALAHDAASLRASSSGAARRTVPRSSPRALQALQRELAALEQRICSKFARIGATTRSGCPHSSSGCDTFTWAWNFAMSRPRRFHERAVEQLGVRGQQQPLVEAAHLHRQSIGSPAPRGGRIQRSVIGMAAM